MKLDDINIDGIKQSIEEAPAEGKSDAIVNAIQKVVAAKYAGTIEQYQKDFIDSQASKDNGIKFGLRNLDAKEISFYDKLAKQEFKGADDVLLPSTIVNYIFEDLKNEHPLFKHLDFVPAGIEKWFLSEHTGKAVWGKITGKITEELEAEITDFTIGVNMISAFMYIPKGILDLGHSWIDRFVRTILQEALEEGLEDGFLIGDGNSAPVGMIRDLDAPVTGGVYAKKTAVAITDFGVDSFNKDVLSVLNDGGKTLVNKIIVVANQNDIDTNIYKATHVLGGNGYVKANLPKEFEFVPSIHMKSGEAIAFLPGSYVAGVTRLGIDTSEHYKFLEHLMTYAIVGYGNGRAKGNTDAVLLDITGLKSLVPEVKHIEGA